MIKYLFVLASDSSDNYYEQAFLAISSLKIHTPNAFVSLLIDDITETTLTGKRENIRNLVNEIKTVKIDSKFNKKARSRWLKTSMRKHIEGDFLYIDNDTIISGDLSEIENINADVGAILDDHTYLYEFEKTRPSRYKEIKKIFKLRNFGVPFDFKIYFNGGVFFCRDTKKGHDFFNEWHRLWLHCFDLNLLTDQPSLNQANYNLGNIICELDGIWNCQLMHDGALKYFFNAKILHYFATHVENKPFLLANIEYTNTIKETGDIDQNTLEMLKNPKIQFDINARIMLIGTSWREYYDSAICGAAKRIYSTKIGKLLEFVFSFIKKNIFTPLRKKLYLKKKKYVNL